MPSQCGQYTQKKSMGLHAREYGKTVVVRFVLATVEILHVQQN